MKKSYRYVILGMSLSTIVSAVPLTAMILDKDKQSIGKVNENVHKEKDITQK